MGERYYTIEEYEEANRPTQSFYYASAPQDVVNIISAIFSKVKDHYMSFFDEDQFKTVRVKMQHEALSDFRKFMHSAPKKPNKPIIIFDPSRDIRIVEETIFSDVVGLSIPVVHGDGSLLPSNNVPIMDFGEMFDSKTILGTSYSINRYHMETDIMMIFNSTSDQLNMYNYMINNIRHKGKYNLTIDTSMIMDKVIMLNVAKFLNKDPLSDEFLNIVNTRSLYPVRRVMYPNGMYDFFITMPLEYYFDIPDRPNMDVYERNGMVEGVVYINSSITVEVDIPASFTIIASEKLLNSTISGRDVKPTPTTTYIPPVVVIENIPRVFEGHTNLCINDVIFQEDKDDVEINFKEVLTIDQDIINYVFSKKNYAEYIKFKIYKNGKDFNDFELKDGKILIKNIKFTDYLTIAGYVNLDKINKEGNARMRYIIGTLNIDEHYIAYKNSRIK